MAKAREEKLMLEKGKKHNKKKSDTKSSIVYNTGGSIDDDTKAKLTLTIDSLEKVNQLDEPMSP